MSDLKAEIACLELVNKIIVQCQLPHPRIGKLSALSHQLVLMLFRACCGLEVPGLIENPRTREEEALNVQAALNVLVDRVLLTSLPHIDGHDVVACNPHVVLDLLEILVGCLDMQGASSSSMSSMLSSPDSSLPASSSERGVRRKACHHCGANGTVTSHSTPRESYSEDSESLYSEASCFLCDYVAAKACSAAARSTSRAFPECPPRNLPSSDTPSPLLSYVTTESSLDDVDAKRFADGASGYVRSKTALEGRRQGSPYWLRGTPKLENSESTESDTSVEERLKATLAELRRRLAEVDKRADDDRPLRKRSRPVKKSVLLSPGVRGLKRAGSSGTSRKRLRSETEVPEDESSPDVNMSPHAERVLRRLHEQHVRFAVQSSSSASDVAVDAERLQRKYEELQERHARMMDALQKDLARSRRLNELDAQRQLHQAIDALENDRRQQAARLKRHHDERNRIMRSRRLSYKHRQQQMLQETFKESIRARKQDLVDIQATVRERQVREQDRHQVYLASLENFYQTQLSLLTESLAKEKVEMKQRAAAQSRVLERMRRDFKEQLEAETQNLYRLVAQPQEGWVSTNQAVPSQKRSRRV
ncbi:centrosomal protein of 131 kDa-like isoform X2 [Dermacentor albipictus]|uniref:centrosomal protein of 131 kDa-like isoform X2 n=1 Tax=Dermacentor albipictus TaxID=60249 RepID=UPI0031FD7178